MRRYHITVGAKTTADGTVMTGYEFWTIDGQPIAREGDEVACPACDSTGVIVCDGPHLVDLMQGRPTALDGDLCHCKCAPPPRLIANQTLQCQEFKDLAPDPRFTPPSASATSQLPATGPRSSNFLDVYPLHVFYQERGLSALEACLPSRKNIYGNGQYPVLWPVAQERLGFGTNYEEILQAFQAIEGGRIAVGVKFLATHEQVNILQPTMYSDLKLVALLRGNHLSHVVNFPSGAAQAIELTLASQCQRVDDGRTIGFDSNLFADLSDVKQRMSFVLKAAAKFDELLQGNDRHLITQSIRNIASAQALR